MQGNEDEGGLSCMDAKFDAMTFHLDGSTEFHSLQGSNDYNKLVLSIKKHGDYTTVCMPRKVKNGVLSVCASYVPFGCKDCVAALSSDEIDILKSKWKDAKALNTKLSSIVTKPFVSPVTLTLFYTPVNLNITDDMFFAAIKDNRHLRDMIFPLKIADYVKMLFDNGIHVPAIKEEAQLVPGSSFWSGILHIWSSLEKNTPIDTDDVIGCLQPQDRGISSYLKNKLDVIEKKQYEDGVAEFHRILQCSDEERRKHITPEDIERYKNQSWAESVQEMMLLAEKEPSPPAKAEMHKLIQNVLKKYVITALQDGPLTSEQLNDKVQAMYRGDVDKAAEHFFSHQEQSAADEDVSDEMAGMQI